MTILVSGGGTGGHITPILAVAHELKKLQPDVRIVYVGERDGKFSHLTNNQTMIDDVQTIFAGKLRRYYGESWFKRLIDIKTLLRNIRDIFYVLFGFVQSVRILSKLKPDIIFLKGGYVGLPIGLAAAVKHIPFITHDSDAAPGLANRLISRWARLHATGLPSEFYNYPKEKSLYVGILVGEDFVPVTNQLKQNYRTELGIPQSAKVLLVTGGSLGAQRLNTATVDLVPELLKKYSDLYIIHQVGKGNQDLYTSSSKQDRLSVIEFMSGMHRYSGAADVVVTRAGANTLAELGVQGKACVVVPNPQLAGGHQLENAKYLVDHKAVLVVNETSFKTQTDELQKAIEQLLDDPAAAEQLGQTLQSVTKKDAAHELAQLLLEAAKL